MRFQRYICALLPALLLTVGMASGARAEVERILDFSSHILVQEDATMTVTETITVQAEGRQIKRGIKRDFPTSYRDRLGNRIRVGFEMVEVLRNGAPEPYSTQAAGNGVQIKIGDKDVFLPRGPHRYSITYRTNRQLGFFADYDELYWNVTGTGWSFAIDRAQAVIELPPGASMIQQSGYTGPQGATAGNYSYTREGGRHVFRTTRALAPREGLTIAVAWPKGYVQAPSQEEKLGYFFADNRSTLVALGGLVVVFGYFLLVWTVAGRDPRKGTIIPRYEPPTGLSPAAMRYIMRMGYDNKAFSAALVSLAVKGRITIEEEGKTYRLKEARQVVSAVSPGERRVAQKLLDSGDSILLHHRNHKDIGGAMKALKKYLVLEYEKGYFVKNRAAFIGGVVLILLTLAAIALSGDLPPIALFLMVWTSGWTLGCAVLIYAVYKAWKAVFTGGPASFQHFFTAIFLSLFSIPFIGGEGFGLVTLSEQITLPATGVFLANILLAAGFYQWLKAPTRAGRKLMDEIEGFKQYLSVAEQDRLETLHPPEKTPELFEKYLPFALALGVEHQWSEQFAGLAAEAGRDRSDRGYHPHWYHGDGWRRDGLSGLGQALSGSFAGAVASSSSPPGSSSGSGGGGSSGGGGGGGGGSGW